MGDLENLRRRSIAINRLAILTRILAMLFEHDLPGEQKPNVRMLPD